VIVNFPLLGGTIKQLEENHDPLTEFVVQGNCEYPAIGRRLLRASMLQGGSGYLISRFGTRQLASRSENLIAHGHVMRIIFWLRFCAAWEFREKPWQVVCFLEQTLSGEIEGFFWERHIRHCQPAT
jgi:hypothetical protein